MPVFLGPGEKPDEMATSDAYKTLSKVLGALRAHDTDTIKALADPRVRSGRDTDDQDQEHDGGDAGDVLEDGDGTAALSRAAAGVLRFSEERDPAVLTMLWSVISYGEREATRTGQKSSSPDTRSG
ncbi:hypothetical protein [Streptomyces atratus]|uniref:hypothetical protein n=1 Tax=Streptomyces atratus TaxID=1893 RepID=UPI00366636AF